VTQQQHILVIHEDRKSQRLIQRILGVANCPIESVNSLAMAEAALAAAPPTLIVVSHELALLKGGKELLNRAASAGALASLVVTRTDSRKDLPTLFSAMVPSHLLGNAMPLFAEELSTTVLKLLHGEIFGLEKYLSWGVAPSERVLANSSERHAAVGELVSRVRDSGFSSRVAAMAQLVADELLSNALYNAPVNSEGERSRAGEPRDSSRDLADRESVRLRYACDARYLAIEITDYFGSLERATVLTHLAKCVRQEAANKVRLRGAGAGMGLGLAYSSCNHLVFNVQPGSRTEAIGLIDVRFTPPELGPSVSSLNVFIMDGGQ
jgi:CheY-like chemotaxis protein